MPCGYTFPLSPACHSLRDNGLGDDAEQALRTAAGSGLGLDLKQTHAYSDDSYSDDSF